MLVGALSVLGWVLVSPFAGAAGNPASEPLLTVRARDQIRLHVRSAYLTFSETIVLAPAPASQDRVRPGAVGVVHVLIAPFWFRDGASQGPAFPELRPQLTLSHGRVQRFGLVRPDGEPVRTIEDVTPDCRYVLTLELSHMLPEKLTITVQMSSPTGLNPGSELIYTPSNDGHPFISGPTESFHTQVHVIADPVLEPWTVVKGQEPVARIDKDVALEREVTHTFRFGSRQH
jgi:hypothetical protein